MKYYIYISLFVLFVIICLICKYLLDLSKESKKLNKLNKSNKSNKSVQFSFNSIIERINTLINDDIDYYISTVKYDKLNEMCKYSMDSGKRIRSILIYTLSNKDLEKCKYGILFIEYLHASSLVMDDIMDNDTYRRNNLCVYKKYGYTYAQLVSIYLLSLSLINLNKFITQHKCYYLLNIVTNNFEKLCRGQYCDINKSCIGSSISINELMLYKTSSLFEISYIIGWISKHNRNNYNYADLNKRINKIKYISKQFGLLFQISDDFEDIEKDYKNNQDINIVTSKGISESVNRFKKILNSFVINSNKLNLYLSEIEEICLYLENKVLNQAKKYNNIF